MPEIIDMAPTAGRTDEGSLWRWELYLTLVLLLSSEPLTLCSGALMCTASRLWRGWGAINYVPRGVVWKLLLWKRKQIRVYLKIKANILFVM